MGAWVGGRVLGVRVDLNGEVKILCFFFVFFFLFFFLGGGGGGHAERGLIRGWVGVRGRVKGSGWM